MLAQQSLRWVSSLVERTHRRKHRTRRRATSDPKVGCSTSTGIPNLAHRVSKIKTTVDVDCSQKKVPYVRADASTCSAAPAPRMTAAEIQAKRDYRIARQNVVKIWRDTAAADGKGVDAIVYPGLLSEISVNDGGGPRPRFGRRDTPSAGDGVPAVVF